MTRLFPDLKFATLRVQMPDNHKVVLPYDLATWEHLRGLDALPARVWALDDRNRVVRNARIPAEIPKESRVAVPAPAVRKPAPLRRNKAVMVPVKPRPSLPAVALAERAEAIEAYAASASELLTAQREQHAFEREKRDRDDARDHAENQRANTARILAQMEESSRHHRAMFEQTLKEWAAPAPVAPTAAPADYLALMRGMVAAPAPVAPTAAPADYLALMRGMVAALASGAPVAVAAPVAARYAVDDEDDEDDEDNEDDEDEDEDD